MPFLNGELKLYVAIALTENNFLTIILDNSIGILKNRTY